MKTRAWWQTEWGGQLYISSICCISSWAQPLRSMLQGEEIQRTATAVGGTVTN